MADITLHRAGRILEAIRAAVGGVELGTTAKVSIFGEPVAELARKTAGLASDIDKIERLLSVQSRIRATVGRANAELGISDLLAEKAAADEWIKLVSPLVSRSSGKAAGLDYVMRRSRGDATDPANLEARAKAMRERYAASDAEVDAAIETRVLDQDAAAGLAKRIAQRRREVELLSDRLRTLNARTVVLDEADLEYLTSQDVI